jgi:hypothetical protein
MEMPFARDGMGGKIKFKVELSRLILLQREKERE